MYEATKSEGELSGRRYDGRKRMNARPKIVRRYQDIELLQAA
jgi:hypothetical protein